MTGKIIMILIAMILWGYIIIWEFRKGTQFNEWKELLYSIFKEVKEMFKKLGGL